MRKITKKVLSTVLVLSLLAGFSAVSSFATEGCTYGGEMPDGTDDDLISLFLEWKDKDFGNYSTDPNFDISRELCEFVKGKIPFWNNEKFVSNDPELKWYLVGDILYLVKTEDDSCEVRALCPLYLDDSGNPCYKNHAPIEIIKIPEIIDRMPVTSFNYLGGSLQELFPDLKYLLLPNNIKNVFNRIGLDYVGRPYKIFVPYDADCNINCCNGISDKLEGGLHTVMNQRQIPIYLLPSIDEKPTLDDEDEASTSDDGDDEDEKLAAELSNNSWCTIM